MNNLDQAESLIRHIYTYSSPSPQEILKANVLRIAADHRDKCSGEDCNISLSLLREVAEKAGLRFTYDETRLFL